MLTQIGFVDKASCALLAFKKSVIGGQMIEMSLKMLLQRLLAAELFMAIFADIRFHRSVLQMHPPNMFPQIGRVSELRPAKSAFLRLQLAMSPFMNLQIVSFCK